MNRSRAFALSLTTAASLFTSACGAGEQQPATYNPKVEVFGSPANGMTTARVAVGTCVGLKTVEVQKGEGWFGVAFRAQGATEDNVLETATVDAAVTGDPSPNAGSKETIPMVCNFDLQTLSPDGIISEANRRAKYINPELGERAIIAYVHTQTPNSYTPEAVIVEVTNSGL